VKVVASVAKAIILKFTKFQLFDGNYIQHKSIDLRSSKMSSIVNEQQVIPVFYYESKRCRFMEFIPVCCFLLVDKRCDGVCLSNKVNFSI